MGKCPQCGEWNSFVEEVENVSRGKRNAPVIGNTSSRPLKLSEVKVNADERMNTEDEELNRVLGGGLVPGSMILLGGEPGIGKSTLVLQFALRNHCGKVLYVSGEESRMGWSRPCVRHSICRSCTCASFCASRSIPRKRSGVTCWLHEQVTK